MVGEFKKRRNAMVQALNTIPGFRCSLPAGAFYAFPNITGTKMSSKDVADFLLNEAGVACLSGTAFGQQGANAWELRAATSLGRLLARAGRQSEAQQTLGEVHSRFTEGFDTTDIKDAKALLDQLAT